MNDRGPKRKPDFNVGALDKTNDLKSNNVGAAWKQPDGSIQIKLNGFVVLDTTKADVLLTLFPADQAYTGNKTFRPVAPGQAPVPGSFQAKLDHDQDDDPPY